MCLYVNEGTNKEDQELSLQNIPAEKPTLSDNIYYQICHLVICSLPQDRKKSFFCNFLFLPIKKKAVKKIKKKMILFVKKGKSASFFFYKKGEKD